MKISELIDILEELKQEFGDINAYVSYDELGFDINNEDIAYKEMKSGYDGRTTFKGIFIE